MKLILTQAARINHPAGDIVEVSPAQADFLLSIGGAVKAEEAEAPAQPKKQPAKKSTK